MARKRRYEKAEEEVDEYYEDDFFEEEESEPFWREEGVPNNLSRSYGRTNNLFTIKIRANGRFMKFGAHRVYSGGGLDDELVQPKTQEDVDEMIRWAQGVRKIGIFVTHPSRKLAKSLLLGEIYDSIRSMWPKATLKELDDKKANSLGFKENSNKKIPLLPWYPDDSIVVEEENVEGG
ncbi:hypothetical protein LIER_10236 [Lithospermum erythrorhizon]|uniref:Uncharacterized protein n=1 Tax=Lithospermum erythrorhizon TaxID=34254 RepID=A0AAV3PLF6_LITER